LGGETEQWMPAGMTPEQTKMMEEMMAKGKEPEGVNIEEVD